jgi:tRNA nucleotidyltransferase (CCA-adding enzyme)
MTGHEYLEGILSQQTLQDWELRPLREARQEIENLLKTNFGWSTKFYYGGSYAKGTMIRLNYDLDIVIYFDSEKFATLREMYESVYGVLYKRFPYQTQEKTVAIQISYPRGFHIDVVPARLIGFTVITKPTYIGQTLILL